MEIMQLENIALKVQLQDFEHTLKLFLSNRDIINNLDINENTFYYSG